jgi:hypothetical protein
MHPFDVQVVCQGLSLTRLVIDAIFVVFIINPKRSKFSVNMFNVSWACYEAVVSVELKNGMIVVGGLDFAFANYSVYNFIENS